jgi:hypothetical protein
MKRWPAFSFPPRPLAIGTYDAILRRFSRSELAAMEHQAKALAD